MTDTVHVPGIPWIIRYRLTPPGQSGELAELEVAVLWDGDRAAKALLITDHLDVALRARIGHRIPENGTEVPEELVQAILGDVGDLCEESYRANLPTMP